MQVWRRGGWVGFAAGCTKQAGIASAGEPSLLGLLSKRSRALTGEGLPVGRGGAGGEGRHQDSHVVQLPLQPASSIQQVECKLERSCLVHVALIRLEPAKPYRLSAPSITECYRQGI